MSEQPGADPGAGPGAGPSAGPVPGWYPDPYGVLRWWDGHQWGVAALGGSAGTSDPKQMAMLAQLLGIFSGFLGPLIVYLTVGKDDPFVRHHASEALNFQLTVLVATIVSAVLMLVLIGFVLIFVVSIGALVSAIVATMAASRGEWYRYPVCIRFVSGAL